MHCLLKHFGLPGILVKFPSDIHWRDFKRAININMMWTFQLSRPNCIESRAFKNVRRPCFFVVHPLYFNYAPLSQKLIYALFLSQNLNYAFLCRPERFARKSLLSGKFSTFLPLSSYYGFQSSFPPPFALVLIVYCLQYWQWPGSASFILVRRTEVDTRGLSG